MTNQQYNYFHSYGLVIMIFFYVQETTDDDLQENRRVGRANFIVYVSSVQDSIARKQTESMMQNNQSKARKVCCDKRVFKQEWQDRQNRYLKSGARSLINGFTALATLACGF